jgi:membrane protein implicated in regulation of membrane protease activity
MLQLIASLIGGGDAPDDLPDTEVNADHGISFQFITVKNLIGFFTIFSWTGIACLDSGLSQGVTLVISTLSGLMMMGLMAAMFYFMTRMNTDGTMKIQKAIGQRGEVYLTIGSKRKSVGKVQIKVTGSLRTLDAMTDDEDDISTGKLVTVSNVINDSILLVSQK